MNIYDLLALGGVLPPQLRGQHPLLQHGPAAGALPQLPGYWLNPDSAGPSGGLYQPQRQGLPPIAATQRPGGAGAFGNFVQGNQGGTPNPMAGFGGVGQLGQNLASFGQQQQQQPPGPPEPPPPPIGAPSPRSQVPTLPTPMGHARAGGGIPGLAREGETPFSRRARNQRRIRQNSGNLPPELLALLGRGFG